MINKINNTLKLFPEQDSPRHAEEKNGTSFGETLKKAISEINELQEEKNATTESFIKGEITDFHQVMIATEKARIGLELMLEIRNKLVEGYQEIMRMQV